MNQSLCEREQNGGGGRGRGWEELYKQKEMSRRYNNVNTALSYFYCWTDLPINRSCLKRYVKSRWLCPSTSARIRSIGQLFWTDHKSTETANLQGYKCGLIKPVILFMSVILKEIIRVKTHQKKQHCLLANTVESSVFWWRAFAFQNRRKSKGFALFAKEKKNRKLCDEITCLVYAFTILNRPQRGAGKQHWLVLSRREGCSSRQETEHISTQRCLKMKIIQF